MSIEYHTKNIPPKWTLGWGVTSRCDLFCKFCYSKLSRKKLSRKDVGLSDAKKFLENNSLNIKSINFGTGESFLMPEFPDLLDLCKKVIPNINIAVTTNGAISNNIEADSIKIFKNNIHELDVSIDFSTPAQHDSFRGKTGIWQKAVDALSLGKFLGMKVTIVMVGMPDTTTISNLKNILEVANHFDVALRINSYMPTSGDFSYTLSYSQIKQTLDILISHSYEIKTSDPIFSLILNQYIETNPMELNSIRILSDGSMSPSTYLLTPPWNDTADISTVDLNKLGNQSNFRNWSNLVTPSDCLECIHLYHCKGGSRERRILWYGSLEHRDPYCPILNKDFELIEIKSNYRKSRNNHTWKGPNIHLDYLPTIICKPSQKDEMAFYYCSKALVFKKETGKILIIKKRGMTYWEIPGGGIESNENEISTLKRELVEELGILFTVKILKNNLKWMGGNPESEKVTAGTTYLAEWISGDVILSEEHEEYCWCNIEDFNKKKMGFSNAFQKIYRLFLEDYLNLKQR